MNSSYFKFLPVLLLILFSYVNAGELPPGKMLLPESALPEYEAKINHAQLIKDKSKNVLKMGESVYELNCQSCHGRPGFEGSIPNSLKFWEGKFQHGSDPHTMYKTLTRGWRLMVPQVMLTPREKYAVVHYVRETLIKESNSEQYFNVDQKYLNSLPSGRELGPTPVKRLPWKDMDYGRFLMGSFEIADSQDRAKPSESVGTGNNLPYKAIAIRLDQGDGGVSQGREWVAFEHDTLRIAGIWKGEGFIDWRGINFDGRHVVRPRTIGEPLLESSDLPGWANPETGTFEDQRIKGLDGNRYGPLPPKWCQYLGLYKHENKTIVSYRVGKAEILETHDLTENGSFVRFLSIGKSPHRLSFRMPGKKFTIKSSNSKLPDSSAENQNSWILSVEPEDTPVNLSITLDQKEKNKPALPVNLKQFTNGGTAEWKETLSSAILRGSQSGPFQVDEFTLPLNNPWKSRMRASGIDFSPDGMSAYLCFWDGDVWKVDGIADESAFTTQWQRIASGLFQPLGVKLRNGEVFVSCRDQIVRLQDLNEDGETDFYEAFNSDHQVTEHFHEFAMGLQSDEDGNFYYAKSARHARKPLVPHHGTLIKVSKNGKKTEILANGFRAANGVCRNPDGSFFVTDQEGHWNPQNRINHVIPGNNFYGNMWSYGAPEDSSDSAMKQPLCWTHKQFDRSPAELIWVDSEKWGNLNGKLLHMSYGHGRIEVVPHETLNGQVQGGLCRLPIPDLPTGTMRGRFHPDNEHLYLAGMSAWGSAQAKPGGFYRLRATGKPMYLPSSMRATKQGIEITFTDRLSEKLNASIQIKTWALKRTKNYGSRKYDEKNLKVVETSLSKDALTLMIEIPHIAPCWQMSVRYKLDGESGDRIEGEIQNTIHTLAEL